MEVYLVHTSCLAMLQTSIVLRIAKQKFDLKTLLIIQQDLFGAQSYISRKQDGMTFCKTISTIVFYIHYTDIPL